MNNIDFLFDLRHSLIVIGCFVIPLGVFVIGGAILVKTNRTPRK